MKKVIVIGFLFVLVSAFALQTTWVNDDAHSQVQFTVVHLGISDVSGFFRDFDASITAEKEDFSDAVFTFSAKTASIDTRVEMRDNHLKSVDFFDVEKYPTMEFKSTSITSKGNNLYELKGNLTLLGTSKPVTLELQYRGTILNSQSNKQTAGFSARGTIDRRDFNLGSGFPPPMISNEVRIKVDGEFTKN